MGPDDISHFHQILEARMREANRNSKVPKFVCRIELVQRRSIMYYQQQSSQPFLKIVVALPTMVTSCRGILDRGIQIDGLGMKSFMTYESNVLFALRFMIDCNIVGGNWIEIPGGKYKKTSRNHSYCQLEFDCLTLASLTTPPSKTSPPGHPTATSPRAAVISEVECCWKWKKPPSRSEEKVVHVNPEDRENARKVIKKSTSYFNERETAKRVMGYKISMPIMVLG